MNTIMDGKAGTDTEISPGESKHGGGRGGMGVAG